MKKSLKRHLKSSKCFRWCYYRYVYWVLFKKREIRALIKKHNQAGTNTSLFRIWWLMVIKLWLPEEFYAYKYSLLSRKGRKQYVLNWEKDFFSDMVNDDTVHNLLDNKYNSYHHFKEYYGREIIKIDFVNNVRELEMFLNKHRKVVVKKNTGGSGHGVRLICSEDFKSIEDFRLFLEKTYGAKQLILEEFIEQDYGMSCFHPMSVNTLRMPAIRLKDRILLFHPGMRIGRGSSVVDNGGSGGILAAIDANTGIIVAAATEDGTDYYVHPDTGIPIIGYKIPQWEEAQVLTRKLMEALPEGIYISWDLALTKKGWIMVEGNGRGQFFGRQLPIHKGVRNEFETIKRELGI